jgi:cycloeucalenol cycloisomerase
VIRRDELAVLAYTPVWMAVVAWVLFSRVFTHWGDLGHMALGVGLALPLLLLPLWRREALRFTWAVLLMSLLQNYFGTIFFYDTLGMSYHFPVSWTLHRTPIFLYFMTIPYFATYYIVMILAWRRFAPESALGQLLFRLLLSVGIAFGEMFFMVNDRLRDFYTYRDEHFALTWGSLFYGAVFFFSLPVFVDLEKPRLATRLLAANMLTLIAYELFTHVL